MNANQTLDYRPYFSLTRNIDATAPDAEIYEDPLSSVSAPVAVFKRNRPSVVLNDVAYAADIVSIKLQDLSKDLAVKKFSEAPASLARQILYANMNDIAGNTNILVYDRLSRIEAELQKKMDLVKLIFFGDVIPNDKVFEEEEKMFAWLTSVENGGEGKINYEAMNLDIKALHLMSSYLYDVINAADYMIGSNEPLENNIYTPDRVLMHIYELKHERAVQDILEGKHSSDVQLDNDSVGNKLKRLYNLRTKLTTMSDGLTEEQVKDNEEQIAFAEQEASEQIATAMRELYKAVQSQSLSLKKFNQGFNNKCEILHNLKGGFRT